jgi:hypothetical protein
MPTFISETLDDILQSQSSFEDCVFVLPSQRAGVFVKNELKQKLTQGFLPEILTIEQFTQNIAEIQQGDTIQLLFHFYKVYCEIEEHPDAFDVFSSWAFVVMQDFNEVDQYLVNTEDIFNYLRDIQRLRKWSVKGEFKETELIKDHFIFMERLGKYYNRLSAHLLEENLGYQGLIYRQAVQKVASFLERHSSTRFYFIGFNALNRAEESLIQSFLATGRSEIYWDIDQAFFESYHAAGNFIRKYYTEWRYYDERDIKLISSQFSEPKNIQVIGTTKNVSQLKYAGEILEGFQNYQNTALVLGDESLLSVALNSIPKKVAAINITMGYPLQNIPVSHFIIAVFQLFITQEKLLKSATNEFYYKDVLRFFKNPLMFQLLKEKDAAFILKIQTWISAENRTFISLDVLQSYLSYLNKATAETIVSIFQPYDGIEDFINRILSFIENIRSKVTRLEKEYLFRFYTAFTQLKNLNASYAYFQDIKTLYQFYRRIVASEKLSFQGEPLKGLQVMGMLETRVLDFENVIITSVNEGILPSNNTQSTFIPFDVKLAFGLPTYKEKDAIFSYHFFRLLQRAKNVYLLYNTENDSFGNGEKSRFITQLELMRDDLIQKSIAQKVITEKTPLQEIKKNPQVLEKLKEFAEKGISPSAIIKYLYNPIEFYKERVLGIREADEVEETVAANTLGTIVHDTLDELYAPLQGQLLTVEAMQYMQQQSERTVEKYFVHYFKNGDFKRGKNRMIYEVAKKYVTRFLDLEIDLIKAGNQIKIVATEQKLETQLRIDGIDFPITIRGIVDRIDEYNGTTRIVDYKTGLVTAKQLKVSDLEDIKEHAYEKAIQVLLYALLHTKNTTIDASYLQAGIYSLRNLKDGFLPINFSQQYRGKDYEVSAERLEKAVEELSKIIAEIYNPLVAFQEPEELPY